MNPNVWIYYIHVYVRTHTHYPWNNIIVAVTICARLVPASLEPQRFSLAFIYLWYVVLYISGLSSLHFWFHVFHPTLTFCIQTHTHTHTYIHVNATKRRTTTRILSLPSIHTIYSHNVPHTILIHSSSCLKVCLLSFVRSLVRALYRSFSLPFLPVLPLLHVSIHSIHSRHTTRTKQASKRASRRSKFLKVEAA